MSRSQSSLIELLLMAVCASACITMIFLTRTESIETNRYYVLESEEALINFLNYRPAKYNETMSFLIIFNESLFNDELFNESREVIGALNGETPFILYINISSGSIVYNNQSSACLKEARLASHETIKGEVIYGWWKGEVPLKC